jgi:hypothetical protein
MSGGGSRPGNSVDRRNDAAMNLQQVAVPVMYICDEWSSHLSAEISVIEIGAEQYHPKGADGPVANLDRHTMRASAFTAASTHLVKLWKLRRKSARYVDCSYC